MIRQICPSCFHPIELPDEAAGNIATCPLCAKPFPVPLGYVPAVDAERPPPPPGLVPPSPPAPAAERRTEPSATPPPGLVTPAAAEPPPPPAGYTKSCGVTLSPGWIAWIPPAALTGVFLLTLFSWVGTFPGGFRVFTQTPWQAVFGHFSNQTLFEAASAEKLELDPLVHADLAFLLPFLLLLLAGIGLAWADVFGRQPDGDRLPRALGWVSRVWPVRLTLATAFAAAGLVLVVVQVGRGFGLESAVELRIAEMVAKEQAARTPPGQSVPPPSPFLLGEKEGHFSLSGTNARDAAVFLQALAVVGLFARLWLDGRGPRPLPRVTAHW